MVNTIDIEIRTDQNFYNPAQIKFDECGIKIYKDGVLLVINPEGLSFYTESEYVGGHGYVPGFEVSKSVVLTGTYNGESFEIKDTQYKLKFLQENEIEEQPQSSLMEKFIFGE